MNAQYCYGCMEPVGQEAICPHCGFRQADYQSESHHLKPGTRLRDRYVVGRVLGEGGFGITYIGRDPVFERKVAVKEFYMAGYVLRNHAVSDEVTTVGGTYGELFSRNREKFLDEARTLAKFEDEAGIVNVRDFFQENNTAYIVMDFLDGVTLRDYVKKAGKLSGERVLQILEPVFHSLANIHAHGLIHRDISPDNIMLTKDGKVKLLDFGAARAVSKTDIKSLSVILKPGYAPEEQYRSKGKQGPWTDVYALSATIYRCITGIVPDDSMERMFDDKLVSPAELGCDCSKAMSDALMKGLSIRQPDRYQSIPELWEALTKPAAIPEDPERTVTREPLDAKTVVGGTEWARTEDAPKPVTVEPARPAETQPKVQTAIPEPTKPEEQPEPPVVETQKKKSKLPILLGICIVAAIAAFAIWHLKGGLGVPETFDDYSITIGSKTISVPTTFAELEDLGWTYYDPERILESGESDGGRCYGYSGDIWAYGENLTEDPLTIDACSVYQISVQAEDIESGCTVQTPGGFVLGKTTLTEFKESAPFGYTRNLGGDYTHCEYRDASAPEDRFYEFSFDENEILKRIRIRNTAAAEQVESTPSDAEMDDSGSEPVEETVESADTDAPVEETVDESGFDPYNDREIYFNGDPLSVPTTFDELAELGWELDSEGFDAAYYQEHGVEAGHSTGTITLINDRSKIYVTCKNMTDTTKGLQSCTIREIEVSMSALEYDAYVVEIPGGYVLGQTTLAEFEATAPAGCQESTVGTARYYDHWFFGFNEEGILDTVRVNHY